MTPPPTPHPFAPRFCDEILSFFLFKLKFKQTKCVWVINVDQRVTRRKTGVVRAVFSIKRRIISPAWARDFCDRPAGNASPFGPFGKAQPNEDRSIVSNGVVVLILLPLPLRIRLEMERFAGLFSRSCS